MPKIERRRTTVTLISGQYEAELAALSREVEKAHRDEESGAVPKRSGTKSLAVAKAREWDAKRDEVEANGVEVTIWALSYTDYGPLQDQHPPRDDDAEDKRNAVNGKTFPPDLLRCSLVAPDEAVSFDDLPDDAARLDDLRTKGAAVLKGLGDLTRVQYMKLENAAWNVNEGDDALPKFSLVSWLQQLRDPDSKPQSDSE